MEDYQKEVSEISHNKAVTHKYTKEWEEEQKALERERIGTKRGEKLGMERGIKQGISQTRREVAEKMLRKNMDINDIVEISELSKEEIEKIKKTIK